MSGQANRSQSFNEKPDHLERELNWINSNSKVRSKSIISLSRLKNYMPQEEQKQQQFQQDLFVGPSVVCRGQIYQPQVRNSSESPVISKSATICQQSNPSSSSSINRSSQHNTRPRQANQFLNCVAPSQQDSEALQLVRASQFQDQEKARLALSVNQAQRAACGTQVNIAQSAQEQHRSAISSFDKSQQQAATRQQIAPAVAPQATVVGIGSPHIQTQSPAFSASSIARSVSCTSSVVRGRSLVEAQANKVSLPFEPSTKQNSSKRVESKRSNILLRQSSGLRNSKHNNCSSGSNNNRQTSTNSKNCAPSNKRDRDRVGAAIGEAGHLNSSKIVTGKRLKEGEKCGQVDVVGIEAGNARLQLDNRSLSSRCESSEQLKDTINMTPSSSLRLQNNNNHTYSQQLLWRDQSHSLQANYHEQTNSNKVIAAYSNTECVENDLDVDEEVASQKSSPVTCESNSNNNNRASLGEIANDNQNQDDSIISQPVATSQSSTSASHTTQEHIPTSARHCRAFDNSIASDASNTSLSSSKKHQVASDINNNSNNNNYNRTTNLLDHPIATRVDNSDISNNTNRLTQFFNDNNNNTAVINPSASLSAFKPVAQDYITQTKTAQGRSDSDILLGNHFQYAGNQANEHASIGRMSNCGTTASYSNLILNQQMRSADHHSNANYSNYASNLLDDYNAAIPLAIEEASSGIVGHYHNQQNTDSNHESSMARVHQPHQQLHQQQMDHNQQQHHQQLSSNQAHHQLQGRVLASEYVHGHPYNSMPTPSSKSSSPNSSVGSPPPSTNNNKISRFQQTQDPLVNQACSQTNTNNHSSTSNSSSNSLASLAIGVQHQSDHHYMTTNNTNHQTQNYGANYGHQTTVSQSRQVAQSNDIPSLGHDDYEIHSAGTVQNQHHHLQYNHQNHQHLHLHQHYQQQQQQQQSNQHLQQQHNQNQQNQNSQHHQNQQHHHSQQHSLYHQLASNQIYGSSTVPVSHYQGHHHIANSANGTNNESQSLHTGSQMNSAAVAAQAAAAAVVSQTLKSVANHHQGHAYATHHHHQHHHPSIGSGFGSSTSGIMSNIAHSTHHNSHQTFQSMSHQLNHHLTNQAAAAVAVAHQHQHQHQQHQLHQHHNHHHHHQQLHHSNQSSLHHVPSLPTRKYQCKMCPQVFMSKAEMKYHNQNHMREAKPYKCSQCPKAFANSSYLSQHMRIHQGVKPYSCDICSRKFTQLSHLQQHKRTHTGDKPYKCSYPNCTKQFSQLSNLQSHSRSHQLDKPYKCNSCYKCFQDETSLLEHIPRHLESKHLKKNLCVFCGSSYQHERGLVKHFQQYHTDKTPTLVAAAIAAGTTGDMRLIASLVSKKSSQTNNYGANQQNSLGCGSVSLDGSASSSLAGVKALNSANLGAHSVLGSSNGYHLIPTNQS